MRCAWSLPLVCSSGFVPSRLTRALAVVDEMGAIPTRWVLTGDGKVVSVLIADALSAKLGALGGGT